MSNTYILKLPHLKIQNANALSSPYTIGFPAMTAWLGFMHALERKLREKAIPDMVFDSIAVISHACDLQTYRGADDFVSSIIGTANPLNNDGTRAAFIEEARCHLDVSLLIQYGIKSENELEGLPEKSPLLETIHEVILTMKLAGGDILSLNRPATYIIPADDNEGQAKRSLLNSVMPGYALIERRDLMIEAMKEGQDAMDAMLGYLIVDHQCEVLPKTDKQGNEQNLQFTWRSQRKTAGWIVPIATGYQGISPLGQAKNQRDPTVLHQFAESLVTLGEFILANRASSIYDILWGFKFDEPRNLYLCQPVLSEYHVDGE